MTSTVAVGVSYVSTTGVTGTFGEDEPATQPDSVDANGTSNAVSGDQADVRRSAVGRFWLGLKDAVPSLVANGLLYVTPAWVRFSYLVFATLALVAALGWSVAEFYWSGYTVGGFGSRIRGFVR